MTGAPERILDELTQGLKNLFGNDLLGVYLTGSIALGGYHDGKSDIDFTVLIQNKLDAEQTVSIKTLHGRVKKKYPHHTLEGHYITPDELGKEADEIDPVAAYYRGKVSRSYHGISPVTWYTLKKYGVTVRGIPAKELAIDAKEDALARYVIENVNTYWVRWLSGTKRFFSVKGLYALTPTSVEWCVLGISRMFFTLSERDVTAKDAVISYTMRHVPPRYQRIQKEAQRIRTGAGPRQYASPFTRRREMIAYMAHMIAECNRLAGQSPSRGGSSSM